MLCCDFDNDIIEYEKPKSTYKIILQFIIKVTDCFSKKFQIIIYDMNNFISIVSTGFVLIHYLKNILNNFIIYYYLEF